MHEIYCHYSNIYLHTGLHSEFISILNTAGENNFSHFNPMPLDYDEVYGFNILKVVNGDEDAPDAYQFGKE